MIAFAQKAAGILAEIIVGTASGPGDWTRLFESIDRHGQYVRRQKGRPEERFTVPGGEPISKTMKLVGLAFAGWADYKTGGDIFGGWRRLVVATSMSRASVNRARGRLRAAGWVELVTEAGQELLPRTWSNVYQLTIPPAYVRFREELLIAADPDHPDAGDLDRPRGRHARAWEPPRPLA